MGSCSTSALVVINVAAVFCVSTMLPGINPKNGGKLTGSRMTLTCSVCVTDCFSAFMALTTTVTWPLNVNDAFNRNTPSCQLVMIAAVLITTFESGELISLGLFELGPTGVERIFASTSKPLVNCPKMPFWKSKFVGGWFVGFASEKVPSVIKNCESSESKLPLATALAITN